MSDVKGDLIKYANVLERYAYHLMDLKSKKSMKFKKGSAPVKKFKSFYVIGDAKGASECYIDTHGKGYSNDYVMDNRSFRVPEGVHVKFYAPAGYALAAPSASLRFGSPIACGTGKGMHYGPGKSCPNYILTKFQGRHSGLSQDDWKEEGASYEGLQAVAKDADVVFVTVRNRWFHSGVTLSEAIETVRKAFKTITTFHCLFCRVDDTSATLPKRGWDARTGTWHRRT
jgi:hypothetical protein